MIGHYLSNNNKICYSTKIQIFSPTKHALNRPPMHLSLSAVSRCTCTPTQTLVFVVCSSGWSVKSTPTHQQREDHQARCRRTHTQAYERYWWLQDAKIQRRKDHPDLALGCHACCWVHPIATFSCKRQRVRTGVH